MQKMIDNSWSGVSPKDYDILLNDYQRDFGSKGANEFIKAINSTYQSTIPQLVATSYEGVVFP